MIETPPVGQESLARHRLVATSPALWSYWPFLPLVRRTGEAEEQGLLFDLMGVRGETGSSATAFFCNLFLLPPSFDEFLALPKEVHDTAKELLDAGWRID